MFESRKGYSKTSVMKATVNHLTSSTSHDNFGEPSLASTKLDIEMVMQLVKRNPRPLKKFLPLNFFKFVKQVIFKGKIF